MLEAIRMLGIIVFILSAPLVFAISIYETHHPGFKKKMQKVIERHPKISTICICIYVLLAEIGILMTFALNW